MQFFQEGLLALQKLKTGGRQTMIVQHVQVSDGGSALVAASVNGGSPSRKFSRDINNGRQAPLVLPGSVV
jgi:hypothetical protein